MKIKALFLVDSIMFTLPIFLFCGCGANVKMNQQGQVGMCIPFDFPKKADLSAAPAEKEEPKASQTAN
ncbi:MAG: hypothetical protein PHS09_05665 [Candidatus Omnitrophica bacterium]|nr:hypothetical protein [Candidatus Omnitrophota bacterium]